jgi:acetylglutamate kinase
VVVGGPPEPVDFGHVGDVDGFDLPLLRLLMDTGYVPVLSSLGCAPQDGAVFNINADVVAAALAGALRAARLVLVTGAPGVLADPADPSTRMPRLSRAEARDAIAAGRIHGGMIPKLEEAFAAMDQGVPEVLIVGRLSAGDLVRALGRAGEVGTLLVP